MADVYHSPGTGPNRDGAYWAMCSVARRFRDGWQPVRFDDVAMWVRLGVEPNEPMTDAEGDALADVEAPPHDA
jgi:hypothetical protein